MPKIKLLAQVRLGFPAVGEVQDDDARFPQGSIIRTTEVKTRDADTFTTKSGTVYTIVKAEA